MASVRSKGFSVYHPLSPYVIWEEAGAKVKAQWIFSPLPMGKPTETFTISDTRNGGSASSQPKNGSKRRMQHSVEAECYYKVSLGDKDNINV